MLMIVKNNYHYTERIENCPMSFVANGDIARLRRLRRIEELYGFRFANATLSFGDYDDTELECKILLNTITSDSPSLTYEESQQLFYEVEKDYTDIRSKIKRFQAIRENPYFNALQVKFSYAVTCHKAQGSEFDSVVVFDESWLFGEDRSRWLYTAITRAKKRLLIVR
jgi:exodeoxyribonuclease-5